MMYRISHIKSLILCLSIWIVFGFSSITGQEATEPSIPIDTLYGSIFANDTCAPPCWFGLIPGESTSQEVLEVLRILTSSEQVSDVAIRQNRELVYINLDTSPISNGSYYFGFGPYERENCCSGSSQIHIHEETMDSVNIIAREHISMDEVITHLGLPDEVRIYRFGPFTESGNADFLIEFIYYDFYIRLILATGDGHPSSPIMCNFSAIRETYQIDGAIYYSHQRATELIDVPLGETGQQQPALLVYQPEERHVPQEVWQLMIEDQSITCQDLWETLPQEQILPESWNEFEN